MAGRTIALIAGYVVLFTGLAFLLWIAIVFAFPIRIVVALALSIVCSAGAVVCTWFRI